MVPVVWIELVFSPVCAAALPERDGETTRIAAKSAKRCRINDLLRAARFNGLLIVSFMIVPPFGLFNGLFFVFFSESRNLRFDIRYSTLATPYLTPETRHQTFTRHSLLPLLPR